MVDGTSFTSGISEGDNSQLCYETTLMKPHQERPGNHSWMLWKRILKTLISFPKTTKNKLTKRLGKWIDVHSKLGNGCHTKTVMATSMQESPAKTKNGWSTNKQIKAHN